MPSVKRHHGLPVALALAVTASCATEPCNLDEKHCRFVCDNVCNVVGTCVFVCRDQCIDGCGNLTTPRITGPAPPASVAPAPPVR